MFSSPEGLHLFTEYVNSFRCFNLNKARLWGAKYRDTRALWRLFEELIDSVYDNDELVNYRCAKCAIVILFDSKKQYMKNNSILLDMRIERLTQNIREYLILYFQEHIFEILSPSQ